MLQFIVGRLKEKPFNISIRAVDFDDKHPDEHLQFLNDVLSSLNAELKADLHDADAAKDEVIEDMRRFLVTYRCTCVPDKNDEFGKKEAINRMLHWALSNYESLQNEEYLARYLRPIEVPSEYMFMQSNENLLELFDAYKELQTKFIDVHKQFTVVKVDRSTADIFENIDQLEADKRQLQDRLQREQAQISNNTDFQRLLIQATAMRQAQEDELRLDRQREEQLLSLTLAKRRLQQVNKMLKLVESFEGKTIDIIVDELCHEYQQSVLHLEVNTIPERQNTELMLLRASKKKAGPNEVDVDDVINDDDDTIAEINKLLMQKQSELGNLSAQGQKSSKLPLLKKELIDATTKLDGLQDDFEEKMLLKDLLISENNELCNIIRSLDREAMVQNPDGRLLSRNDIRELQESVNNNCEVRDKMKLEIVAIQARLSELQMTENSIKHQQHEMFSHRQKKDRIAGAARFNDVNDKLVATSKETASLNTMKAKTLEDISAVVQEIAKTLERKEHELKPKIDTLKVERRKFQDLRTVYDQVKAKYHEALVTLTNDNQELENECSRLRLEWREKAPGHQLISSKDKLNSKQTCHLDLEKEPRAQQQRRSNEYISNQKVMFVNLKKLLDFKSKQ